MQKILPSVLDHVSTEAKLGASIYRDLHQIPELSGHEHRTAAFVAQRLQEINANTASLHSSLHTGVGGTGVVWVLRNGDGKIVLLRAELDALPLREDTELSYSSQFHPKDENETTSMHACGHDMHMAVLLCVSRILTSCHQSWEGTLVVLFQPSEENGEGALAMVEAGLYDPKRFAIPKPDMIFAAHLMPIRSGCIRTRASAINAAARNLSVTIHGKGGHGARPHQTVDPIVLASSIVMKLQTIVSRETAPQDAVVITVGSLNAGTAPNVISDLAKMTLNVRALSDEGLNQTLSAIRRIIEGECHAFRCPKPPLIEDLGGFPLLYNSPDLTQNVMKAFKSHFADKFMEEESASLGSEDLANLAVDDVPCCFWNVGCIDEETWDKAEKHHHLDSIPGNHSAQFAPAIEPTLTTAIKSFLVAAFVGFG